MAGEGQSPVPRSGRHPRADRPFFLLAALYAGLSVPLWTAEFLGLLPACGCDGAARHAHEMLLGYAGAVLGGFLLTRVSRPALAAALAAWAAARVGAWAGVGGWTGLVLGLPFPLLLFWLGGRPFLKAARSSHNLVFAPAIATFAAAEALYQLGRLGIVAGGERQGALVAFDLVALMILVMGGRVIPAAMAGLVRREESRELFDRNGPGLELATVGGLAVAAIAHGFGLPEAAAAAGYGLAGACALVRQRRWRLKVGLPDPSMGPIQLGYGALAGGLVLAALAAWSGAWPVADARHAATVAGMGVVTAAMILRIGHIRERAKGPMPAAAVPVSAALALSAALRVAAPLAPAMLMPASALLWSLAFLGVAVALVRMYKPKP